MLPLPPVVAFTLAAIAAAAFAKALAKALAREWQRVNAELEARDRATEPAEQIPTLRRDASGIYRPE
jgi:hypothetical protein